MKASVTFEEISILFLDTIEIYAIHKKIDPERAITNNFLPFTICLMAPARRDDVLLFVPKAEKVTDHPEKKKHIKHFCGFLLAKKTVYSKRR